MSYVNTLNTIISKGVQGISTLSAAEMNFKASPGKWSKKELLGHLIDSAYNNHQRFIRAEKQGNLIFQGYDQEGWVIKNNYQNRNLEELLKLWEAANLHLAAIINGLSKEFINRPFTQHNFHKICMNLLSEGEPTSLSYLIWDYLFHIEHHLAQIIPNYKKINPAFK